VDGETGAAKESEEYLDEMLPVQVSVNAFAVDLLGFNP
ncbi:hypothetical protein KIPB_006043, partial [Kipferlia bialata]